MGDQMMEWCALGLLLRQLRPDRFDEIVDALRETVDVQRVLAPSAWSFDAPVLPRKE